MALTITITPTAGGSTTTYAASAGTPGRYARAFDPGGPIHDIKRFRPTGTDGSIIIRGGNVGQRLNMTVRYIGTTIDIAMAACHDDLAAFGTEAVNIACLGITYTGCNLVPGSVRQTTPFASTGVDAITYFDVSMAFTEDQP